MFLFFLTFQLFFTQKSSDCDDLQDVLKVLPTPLYKPHIDASKSFGIRILKNSAHVEKYKRNGKLKKIKLSGKGFRVQKLQYSRPYLTPKAKISLEKIAARFHTQTKGGTFMVSSVTRTLDDQCRLRKVNRNAALGLSSHNYGNSFDISYIRFNDVLKYNPKMDKVLEKVLDYYVKTGHIYYIREKQQACYHITVRNY